MKTTRSRKLIRFAAATMLIAPLTTALAADFLKCEYRASPERSKVSVTAENLVPGALYTATIKSGTHTRRATQSTDLAGTAEYDFASNRRDIAAGATRIRSDFIVNGKVTAIVTDALGTRVATGVANCVVK